MKKLLGLLLITMCLSTSAWAKVYENTEGNKLSLLEDPQASADYKIELIKKAKHHIHIITFFWDDTAIPKRMALELSKANARGVEVRIVTTFIMTLSTDLFGKGRKNLKAGSDATFSYLSLAPGVDFSLTNSFHEKIFLVDGEKAIIGGRNISDSSLAGKDLEVQMEGPVVNQVQDHFKRMYDFTLGLKIKSHCFLKNKNQKAACKERHKKNQFSFEDKNFFPDQVQYPDGEEARILSHEAVIHQYEDNMSRRQRESQRDDILDTITKIEFKKLRTYNYFLIPTQRFMDYLTTSLAGGSSVEIITNSIESAKFSSNFGYIYALPESRELVEKGAELYQWQRDQKLNYVHEKVLIYDEDHIVIGSHNFGVGSTAVSNEIAIEIKSRPMASKLIEVFEGEKNDSSKTRVAGGEFLDKEIARYKNMIKILRVKLLGRVLKEIY